jgi:hypothetical protein
MLRPRVIREGTVPVDSSPAPPSMAVVGVRHRHGVLSIAHCSIAHRRPAGPLLSLVEGQAGVTTVDPTAIPRGRGGDVLLGSRRPRLRATVLGEADTGRYAAPGSIVIEPVLFRLMVTFGALRGRLIQAERREARRRFLAAVTPPGR